MHGCGRTLGRLRLLALGLMAGGALLAQGAEPSGQAEPLREVPSLTERLRRLGTPRDPDAFRLLEEALNRAVLLEVVPAESVVALPGGGVTMPTLVFVDPQGRRWLPLFTDLPAFQAWRSAPADPAWNLGLAHRIGDPSERLEMNPAVIQAWQAEPKDRTKVLPFAPKMAWKFALKAAVVGVVLNPGSGDLRLSQEDLGRLNRLP